MPKIPSDIVGTPTSVTYAPFSRFRYTTAVTYGNKKFVGGFNPPKLLPNDRDVFYEIKSGDLFRLDRIAYQFYGDPALWWVIAQANSLTNPFEEVTPGQVLRIPSYYSLSIEERV